MTRFLGSIARELESILPRSTGGRLLMALFVVLAAVRLLGQCQAKLASATVPEIGPWWFLLLMAVAFFVAPRRPDPVKPMRRIGLLLALGLLAWPVSLYRQQLIKPSTLLTASVRRASEARARAERTVAIESLGFNSRRELNRLVGRRRDVALDITGYLLVPRNGTYRFEVSCDNRCSIQLDETTLLVGRRAGSTSKELVLEKGRRRFTIRYRQVAGPAHLRVSWNRPGLIELLPLEHFVGSQPGEITSGSFLWKQSQAYAALAVSLILSSLMFCVLLCLAAPLKAFLIAKVMASRQAMKNAFPAARSPFRPGWVVGLFTLALALRVVFVLFSDQPLLYSHQYNYFTNALRIIEHPDPVHFILMSDVWRDWMGWTIAPLYYLFAAGVFATFGPHLLAIRLAQSVLDAVVAVAVGSLGRRLAGHLGTWAGVAYAIFWPAVEMTNYTMTENLHTVLLVGSLAIMASEGERPGCIRAFAGGFVLGLSALTRAVSSAFLGLAALWRLSLYGRSHWLAAALILAGGAAAISPWTARNVFLVGEMVPIESVSFVNLFEDNWFSTRDRMEERSKSMARLSSEAERTAAASEEALRGVSGSPDQLLRKVSNNYRHLLRADGLHHLLSAEQPQTKWQHVAAIVFGDFFFAAGITLFVTFALAGAPGPTRRLILLWSLYYFVLLIAVFHVEVRYRSALVPLVFAGAVGGIRALASGRRKLLTRAAFGVGLWISLATLLPFVGPAWRAAASSYALRPAAAAVARGDLAEAERIFQTAAAKNPRSSRPWFQYGRWLARTRLTEKAIEAYQGGGEIARLAWVSGVVLPQLLREAGSVEESAEATRVANELSWLVDPWIMLEIAWQELPPPQTDEILMAQGDYGAVRGFLHPRGNHFRGLERRTWWFQKAVERDRPPGFHRWSRGKAWLRLIPTEEAPEYRVTLEMGSPFPSTQAAPEVVLRINGGEPTRFELGRKIRPYTVTARVDPGDPIVVRLDAPTWSRAGEPADQGVRVDRMSVTPASLTSHTRAP